MTDKFALKWNDFNSKLSTTYNKHRNESSFYDVTLLGDDLKKVSAHKLVLSASSNYFNEVLSSTQLNTQSFLCLSDINHEEINYLLDFLYLGEVHIEQDKLQISPIGTKI